MVEKTEEILAGTNLAMRALKVEKAIIAIENNKKDALDRFRKYAQDYPNISVEALQVKYPQGGEKQLIDALLKRRVPSGSLPVSIGAVVQNVATVFAIYEAVQKNKPLVERVVTVTGKEVKQPRNFRVRFGVPVSRLIDGAGGMPETTGKVINGGPMMGKALADIDIPVTKGTSGIVLIPTLEAKRKAMRDCIRLGKHKVNGNIHNRKN